MNIIRDLRVCKTVFEFLRKGSWEVRVKILRNGEIKITGQEILR